MNIIKTLKGLYATNQAECLNKLPELFKQYDEGLIQVLPCKVGGTVYQKFGKNIYPATIGKAIINGYTNPQLWIETQLPFATAQINRIDMLNKHNIFLTRKEAEKALKEREHYEQRKNIKKSD